MQFVFDFSAMVRLAARRRVLLAVPACVAAMLAPLPAQTASDGADVVALGQALFFDPALSADGRVACASCHKPTYAFADDKPVSTGVFARRGTRNTPSLLALNPRSLFWDGRRNSLEILVFDPLLNPQEHGLTSLRTLLERVHSGHAAAYERAFPGEPLAAPNVAQALAAYVASLPHHDTPWDRHLAGNTGALTESQQRGYALFVGRAECARCHIARDATLTDGQCHSGAVSVPLQGALAAAAQRQATLPRSERYASITQNETVAALGRLVVTLKLQDIGCFRTPSLRDVARTAPYMHDGSVANLRQAVDLELYWRSPDDAHLNRLNPHERDDLIAFLQALSSSGAETPPPAVRRSP